MNNQNAAIPAGYALAEPPPTGPLLLGMSRVTWIRIGMIAACLVALFWPNLRRLWLKTNLYNGESNWQHSIFVPLIGLYYLYLNRNALRSTSEIADWSPRARALGVWAQVQAIMLGIVFFAYVYFPAVFDGRAITRLAIMGIPLGVGSVVLALAWWSTGRSAVRARHQIVRQASLQPHSGKAPVLEYGARGHASEVAVLERFSSLADSSAQWFGLYSLLWGLLFYAWAIWPGQNDFFKDVSMVFVLFGATLMLGGWRLMKTAWFPIFFLICAIPWPGLMYSRIAMPLQELAASVACGVLRVTGVDALHTGTKIIITEGSNARALNVAEACAGLKSLMTFISVGAAMGFLSHRALWQKMVITFSAIPIAIFCNVMRVTGQGLIDHYVNHNLSESFAHQFVGMIMLIPAFFMILLVGWLMDNLFVEEVDKRALSAGRPGVSAQRGLVIEIPRHGLPQPVPARPQPAVTPAPSAAANELAAAAQRLASVRSGRRSAKPGATDVTPAPTATPGNTPAAGGQEG